MLLFSTACEEGAGLLCRSTTVKSCSVFRIADSGMCPIRTDVKIRLPFSGSLELKIDNIFGTFLSYLRASKPKCCSSKVLQSKCEIGFFSL